jgi:hypothetical protein
MLAAPAMPRHKGKQFLTTVPKVPAGGAGFFHRATYAPEKFNDTSKCAKRCYWMYCSVSFRARCLRYFTIVILAAGYLRAQPLDSRKRAFGSKDASRRDEFTNVVQTGRYRELLRTELKATAKTTAALRPTEPLSELSAPNTSRTVCSAATAPCAQAVSEPCLLQADPVLSRIPKHSYSFFREVSTPTCSRCHRDTFFCKHRPATAEKVRFRSCFAHHVTASAPTFLDFAAAERRLWAADVTRVWTWRRRR